MGINVKTLRKLCFNRVLPLKSYYEFKILLRKKKNRATYTRKPFILSRFSNNDCLLLFRFSKKEINLLLQSLKFPRKNWLANRTKLSGKEGICILLRRLSYPNRYSDLVPLFNRDEGTLSLIFCFMLKWIYNNYAKRLHCLTQNYHTRTCLQELADNTFETGCPYRNVIGFIDGTCRPICRPTYKQRDMYSGYKKGHIFKFQSVVLTNGLIGRLDGPFIGRRHDAAIVHLSGILNEMTLFLTNNDGSYWAVYGELGYTNGKFIKAGFKNHKTLSRQQKKFNTMMSSLRVGVEYGFGKIVEQFAFLDYKKSQKIYLSPLKQMYYVAAFIVNCQTCIRGRNQVSNIFKSYVPTLQEYLK